MTFYEELDGPWLPIVTLDMSSLSVFYPWQLTSTELRRVS